MAASETPVVYQLKVTLKQSKPPVWRRLQVSGDVTLAKLHRILQIAMGWTDSHLHQFRIGENYYSTPQPEWDFDVQDEKKARLIKVAPAEKFRFVYEYDFGDSWEHEITVEKVMPAQDKMTHAVCITGKRACPPENCGGVWGYESLLEAIQNTKKGSNGLSRSSTPQPSMLKPLIVS